MVYQAKLPQKRLQYLPSERVYVGTLLKANIYMGFRDFLCTNGGFIAFSSRWLEWNIYEPLTTFEISHFQISLFTPFK